MSTNECLKGRNVQNWKHMAMESLAMSKKDKKVFILFFYIVFIFSKLIFVENCHLCTLECLINLLSDVLYQLIMVQIQANFWILSLKFDKYGYAQQTIVKSYNHHSIWFQFENWFSTSRAHLDCTVTRHFRVLFEKQYLIFIKKTVTYTFCHSLTSVKSKSRKLYSKYLNHTKLFQFLIKA